jgi:hypothetical protein
MGLFRKKYASEEERQAAEAERHQAKIAKLQAKYAKYAGRRDLEHMAKASQLRSGALRQEARAEKMSKKHLRGGRRAMKASITAESLRAQHERLTDES